MIEKDAFGKDQRLFETMSSLPADEDGPIFLEPWEAQSFALAVSLSESGYFSWKEWAETLGAVILDARKGCEPDRDNIYYLHWLRALERLIAEKNILLSDDLKKRKEAWTRAYLLTPHGKPVELKA